MGNEGKPAGGLDRREFLKGCGTVVVATAAYEAVSLIFNDATAQAGGARMNVPDAPLDAALPGSPEVESGRQDEFVSKGVKETAEKIKAVIKEKVEKKIEVRTPAAICGVRG
jgi:hypothetical protein